MASATEKLLARARQLREQGKPEKALDAMNAALVAGQKKGDRAAVIQGFVDRAITFRHMHERECDVLFAILARKDAETVLELVKTWGVGERLHTAYYMLGQAALLFREYSQAENYFFKSLRYFKGDPAEKGSFRYHWGKSLYLSGEKKRGLLAFSQALAEIKKNAGKADEFLIRVYLSGAYCSFAQVLAKDDPQDSLKYYRLATEIIDSDKRLVVRKKQLKELERFLKRAGVL